ncbi:MAG TPA: hypothetical protein ENN64_00230 [bacterium]|nr:hypothetical protein [bacterium]
MFQKALHNKTRKVLDKLAKVQFVGDNFYLAGGTALALQLGHRVSVDLDFFSEDEIKQKIILNKLNQFNIEVISETEGSLDIIIEGVKLSFLEYKYPLLEDFVEYEQIKIAGKKDIACMKISAISSRGSKKDFFDLYFLLKEYSLVDIFEFMHKKYPNISFTDTHFLKSLTYFDDADDDPDPDILLKISWDEVKEELKRRVVTERRFLL